MSQERVLVTGGTGFLGRAIVEALVEKHPEWNIAVLDVKSPNAIEVSKSYNKYIQADITRIDDVRRAIEEAQPTAVIHAAGIVPRGNARYTNKNRDAVFENNVNGTRNMLEAAREHGVKAFVYTSSVTVITDDNDNNFPNMVERLPTGNATLVYGQSKAAAEALVLDANSADFSTCSLRPSVTLGPGDNSCVPIVHACIEKMETPFIIGSGDNLYDFAYVGNVADAHVLAVENLLTSKTAVGEAFFITNGEPIPFRALCLAIWAEFGHFPPFQVRIPKGVAWFAGYVAEWVTWFTGSEGETLSRGSVKDYCMEGYASIEKARRVLGYNPEVSLYDAVKIDCDDYKKRLAAKAKHRSQRPDGEMNGHT